MTFEWVPTIMTGILSAGLGSYLTYRIAHQKEGRSDFDTITEKWEADNRRLRLEVDSNRSEIINLRDEIGGLQYLIRMLDTNAGEIPIPAWTKDVGGIVRSLNPAYEYEFLAPFGLVASDYIGKLDSSVWAEQTSEAGRRSDSAAFSSTDKYWIGQEEFINVTGSSLGEYVVLKYLLRAGGTVIGIRGLAVPRRLIK
jgi:hypothetical protein